MIISVYLANFFDSWKIITITKSFFLFFSFFKEIILTTKNYNIQLELVNKTTFFKEIEIDFRIGQKKFLFLFIAAIVIVWKILEESHYGQLFYDSDCLTEHNNRT